MLRPQAASCCLALAACRLSRCSQGVTSARSSSQAHANAMHEVVALLTSGMRMCHAACPWGKNASCMPSAPCMRNLQAVLCMQAQSHRGHASGAKVRLGRGQRARYGRSAGDKQMLKQ